MSFLNRHGSRYIRAIAVVSALSCCGVGIAQDSTVPASVVPLFPPGTPQEPDTIEETPTAIITRVGDRVRDRHAREGEFQAYDHFLSLYWQHRTVAIEIIDRVARGGDSITYNMTSLVPLDEPNLRLFFEGKTTPAQYSHNVVSTQVDPLHYTVTVRHNTIERRPIQVGDRIEMEFSPFLKPPVDGRTNYYGTAFLYVVGQGGMLPWEGRGPRLDSHPLPADALLGGRLTSHRQYSNEPVDLFKQMATNLAPVSAQPFVLGRRLHHSDLGTGLHSETGNPVFPELVGKLGNHHVGRSCVACHKNNGRAFPAEPGAPLTSYLVRVGADATGKPHPQLGASLQSQAGQGMPEAGVSISGWDETDGKYADGTVYRLRKPRYQFTGVVPEFFSVRLAPSLVGQGLLEAVEESTGSELARANGGHLRIVSDPVTSEPRWGRFGWKGGQSRVKSQIAGALNNDMGVTTSIYPRVDRGSEQTDRGPAASLSDDDLDLMYRYVATLGVPPRRDLEDPETQRGEKLFKQAQCATCHVATLRTSPHHPLAELRNQTIHPFTDLLLHDLGDGLADNMADGTATAAQWRTTPLWGIGLTRQVGGDEAYLHDGRARSLSEAILWHGGEAQASRESFRQMPATDRAALVRFLGSL